MTSKFNSNITLILKPEFNNETIEFHVLDPKKTPYSILDTNTFINASFLITEFITPGGF
jgi:hypothetical protein